MALNAIEIISHIREWHDQNRVRKCSDIDWIALEALTGIPISDAKKPDRPLTQAERNRRWREKNPEKYAAQRRRYIEKRRGKA